MNFPIARQPFVPAFLTLLLLLSIRLWAVGSRIVREPGLPEALPIGTEEIAPQPLPLPGEAVAGFAAGHPSAAKWLSLLAALLAGVHLGRISVRSNLYGVGTCLTIPLYGIFLCLLAGPDLSLTVVLASALLAYADKHFCASCRSGYSFDALFRASLALGTLILLLPAAAPLLFMLPLAALLFRRTQRETAVAGVGLLLVPALYGYLNWGLGGDFRAPFLAWWYAFTADGTLFTLFRSLPIERIAVAGVILLLVLCGCGSVMIHFYSVRTKPRLILLFHSILLLPVLLVTALPCAAGGDLGCLAVPAAALLPFLFVRMRPDVASALYLCLLAGALTIGWL